MAEIRDVIFDCAYPASLARFWAAVLDGYEVAPYDDAELERLRGKGIDDPEDDPTCADLDAETDRLLGLGASVFATHDRWTTFVDPEGNEFCVAEERPRPVT